MSIREHTPEYVTAYVSIRLDNTLPMARRSTGRPLSSDFSSPSLSSVPACASYVRICQHTSGYVSIRERLVHALRVVRVRLRSVRIRSHAYGGTYLGDDTGELYKLAY